LGCAKEHFLSEHVLRDSNQAGTRDLPGASVKFSVPTIANGKVYIGTQTDVDIYGPIP
jgi:hypothetical protein